MSQIKLTPEELKTIEALTKMGKYPEMYTTLQSIALRAQEAASDETEDSTLGITATG